MDNHANQSVEQQLQQNQNNARKGGSERVQGIDKKLNGPNRPST